MDEVAVRVLTWNVQGAHGVDVAAVAAVVRAAAPDVVGLQEIQRRQAKALAEALGMPSRRWAFKHWPIVARAEGLAVLSPHRISQFSTFALRRAPFWDWRRRIGVVATVELDGRTERMIVVHLSPHGEIDRRRQQVDKTVARATTGEPLPIVVGDLNDLPGAGAHESFLAHGWIDAWTAAHPDADAAAGATNWSAGTRTGRPPDQRLDYVLAPRGSTVADTAVVATPDRFDEFARLSDHVPLVATIRVPRSGPDLDRTGDQDPDVHGDGGAA